jgi:S1-C subfamily serine protease
VGVGFAVPAAVVRRVVDTAMGGGHTVVRPWLGARLQSVTPDVARSLGLARPAGAVVADVWAGGAADRAGLKQGDVIVAVDGRPVVDAATTNYAVGTHKPGDTVQIGVRRGGRDQELALRAEAAPATPAREERQIAGANPFDGATVVNLSPAVADELGLDPFAGPGVLVTKVERGYAASAGLQAGDFVRAVNGREVRTVRDLAGAVASRNNLWQFTIERNGRALTATMRI